MALFLLTGDDGNELGPVVCNKEENRRYLTYFVSLANIRMLHKAVGLFDTVDDFLRKTREAKRKQRPDLESLVEETLIS